LSFWPSTSGLADRFAKTPSVVGGGRTRLSEVEFELNGALAEGSWPLLLSLEGCARPSSASDPASVRTGEYEDDEEEDELSEEEKAMEIEFSIRLRGFFSEGRDLSEDESSRDLKEWVVELVIVVVLSLWSSALETLPRRCPSS